MCQTRPPGCLNRQAHNFVHKSLALNMSCSQAVDETDRLLRQSYQEWLPQVISQLSHPEHFAHQWAASSSGMQGEVTPSSTFGVPAMPFGAPRTVKLIVSATLTRDPSKLQRLALHCPRSGKKRCLNCYLNDTCVG